MAPKVVPKGAGTASIKPTLAASAANGPAKKGGLPAAETLKDDLFRGLDPTSVVQRTNATGGERYEGQVMDGTGKRHGRGLLRWPNGNAYGGEWADGAMCGTGTFLYAVEGDRYSGSFRDDKKHGSGTYTFANGNSYSGLFAVDKRHGRGKYSWMCGDEYDGEWFEGRMHGQGVTAYANGNRYVGQFVDDRREGRGKLSCTDGLAYDGEWVANNRHGDGRLDFPSGDFYVGQWQNDKKHGRGKDSFANGNVYEGEYVANTKHGQGSMKYNNGDSYEGGWAADKMEGRGVYTFANGFVYDGEWAADMRHGFGEYRFPNGHVYRGHWATDRRHGAGKLTLSDSATENSGETYEGTWVDGKMNGDFRVTARDGRVLYRGNWTDGVPSGAGTFFVPVPTAAGERTVAIEGEYIVDSDAKKGMGTIDRVPAPLVQLLSAALKSVERAAGQALPATSTDLTNRGPLTLIADEAMPASTEPTVAPAAEELLTAITEAAALLAADADNRLPMYTELARLANSDLTSALDAFDTASKRRDELVKAHGEDFVGVIRTLAAAAEARASDEHAREAGAVAALEAAGASVLRAEEGCKVAQAELDAAKQALLAARRRKQEAESERRDARAASAKLDALRQSLEAAEQEAGATEKDVAAVRRDTLASLEAENTRLDATIATLKAAVAEAEKGVTAAQKQLKEAAAAKKEQLRLLAEKGKELDTVTRDLEKRIAAGRAEAEKLEVDIGALAVSAQAEGTRTQQAIDVRAAELARLLEEMVAMEADTADVTQEAAAIELECERKAEAVAALMKGQERVRLQTGLYGEEMDALHSQLQDAERRYANAIKEIDTLEAASSASQARRQLRQQLDRELLDAETKLKDADRSVAAERLRNEELKKEHAAATEALGSVGASEAVAGGNAVSRLRKMRTQSFTSEPSTPLRDGEVARSPVTAASATLSSQAEFVQLTETLNALRKKEQKKQEKVARLYDDAKEAAAGWLPPDGNASGESSALAAASRESQLHQVIKLRSQYEKVAKERDTLAAELDALRNSVDDESSDEDGAAVEDRDEERFIREVIKGIRANEQDWRLKYLVDQLEARRLQLAELQKQASYAKDLEQRVQAVNSTISGYRQQPQPRSAGPKSGDVQPPTLRPPGMPPRRPTL
jgi:hypothetical protein